MEDLLINKEVWMEMNAISISQVKEEIAARQMQRINNTDYEIMRWLIVVYKKIPAHIVLLIPYVSC